MANVIVAEDGSLHKACSKCKRVLPSTMFNKANWLRSGLRPDCKDCYRQFKKDWWASQPKGERALRKREQAELKKVGLRRCVVCGTLKPADGDNFAILKECLETTCRACVRAKVSQWVKDNPERSAKLAYKTCKRRGIEKKKRTPSWLSRQQKRQMRDLRKEAKRLSSESGVRHHVDHIVPLIGKNVSGLHVPWNLQIITARKNIEKSNKWS